MQLIDPFLQKSFHLGMQVFTLRKSSLQSLSSKQICLQPPGASAALNIRHNNILSLDSKIPKPSPAPGRAGLVLCRHSRRAGAVRSQEPSEEAGGHSGEQRPQKFPSLQPFPESCPRKMDTAERLSLVSAGCSAALSCSNLILWSEACKPFIFPIALHLATIMFQTVNSRTPSVYSSLSGHHRAHCLYLAHNTLF